MRWSEETGVVSVFRSPSNNSNGNTRDKQGRLITCEHGSRQVTRTEYDGSITVLIDSFDGGRLNAPNDVIVHPDGHIWFTDPGYGILMNYEGHRAEFELPTNVYRLNPDTGEATVVTDELDNRTGSASLPTSPNSTSLTPASHTPPIIPVMSMPYDVIDDARLENGRPFCDMGSGFADGIRCDIDGNLWSSAGWVGEGSMACIFSPPMAISLVRSISQKSAPTFASAVSNGTAYS